MENFIYSIPTTIYFGKGQIEHVAQAVRPYGKKALIVYGGGRSLSMKELHGKSWGAWSPIPGSKQ